VSETEETKVERAWAARRAARDKIAALPAGGRITAALLKEAGACLGQRRRFARVFPKGMRMVRRDILKALGSELSVPWLSTVMGLPEAGEIIFDALVAAQAFDRFKNASGLFSVDYPTTCALVLLMKFPR
jgi:hypothetical protein